MNTTEHEVREEMVRASADNPADEAFVHQGEIEAYYWRNIRIGVSSNAHIGITEGPEAYWLSVSLHGHGVDDYYSPSDLSTLDKVHESLVAVFLSVAQ